MVPAFDDLKDEVVSVLAAVSDTTGNGLIVAGLQCGAEFRDLRKLIAELKATFPDPSAKLDFTILERLPYLVSVSLSTGDSCTFLICIDGRNKGRSQVVIWVIARLLRVVPKGGATFNGSTVPAGVTASEPFTQNPITAQTAVSMTSWMMQTNPEYFPDPWKFDPNRLIDLQNV